MSEFGPWYRVIKRIRNHSYIYDQSTKREGRSIRTRNRYIGPVGGAPVRLSYVGRGGGSAPERTTTARREQEARKSVFDAVVQRGDVILGIEDAVRRILKDHDIDGFTYNELATMLQGVHERDPEEVLDVLDRCCRQAYNGWVREEIDAIAGGVRKGIRAGAGAVSGKGARAEGKAGKKRLRELTTAKPGTTTDDGAAASATNGRGSQIEPGKRVANSPDVAGPTSIPATLVVEKNAATHDTVAPDEARFRLRSKEDGEDAGEGRTFTRTKALEELKSWFHYEWDDDAMGKPIDDATLEDFDGFELETVATTEMSNPDNT